MRTRGAGCRVVSGFFLVLAFTAVHSPPAYAQNCDLYPIGVSTQALAGVAPGTVVSNILNGSQPGSFGWLTWAGSPSVPTLVASLTPPGDSGTYVNPDDPNDHVVSIGDWVQGKPGVSNSKNVRDALDALKTLDITVPVWNQTRGEGEHADYRVSAFARVRLISYHLPGQNRITARFLGFTTCGLQNQAPVVDAGADQTITLPDAANLAAVVTDDGLPAGSAVSVQWSQVGGTGVATFACATCAVTTAAFSHPGEYTLRLTATDSELTTYDDVMITVNRANNPPEAFSQAVSTDEDTALAMTLTGSDPDTDPIEFFIVSPPSFGHLSGTPPDVTYTPTNDYNGPDAFTFKTTDGILESPEATVSITVNPVNDAPVADSQSVTNLEDTVLSITLSGADLEGTPLTYQITGNPAFGTVSAVETDVVRYTPFPDFHGGDQFFFVANDGDLNSATATVTITVLPVNDAPVAHAQSVSTPEDTALGVTLTGSDVDGNALTFAVIESPTNGTLSGTPPDLTYTPSANFNGQDSLAFVVSDHSVTSAPSVVQISVLPVNDAPVADPQSLSTDEDTPLAVTLTGSDIDGDTLSFIVVDGPTNGVLSGTPPDLTYTPFSDFHGPDMFTFVAFDGSVSSVCSVVSISVLPVNDPPVADPQAVLTDEDTALPITLSGYDVDGDPLTYIVVALPTNGMLAGLPPSLTYTPSANFNGSDSFSFVTFDGSVSSVCSVVHIVVGPVNDPPLADAGPDQLIDFPSNAVLSGSATDIDSSLVTGHWSQVTGPAAVTFTDADALATTVSFATSGIYVLRLTVSDGELEHSDELQISVNGAPAVGAGADQIVEYGDTVSLAGTATDDGLPPGSTVSVAWNKISGPGTVVFSNAAGVSASARFSQVGDYVLRLSATDSRLLGVDDVAVSVRPPGPNQAPVVDAGPDQTIGLTSEATLEGSMSDDGLPWGSPVTGYWSLVTGPGTVDFAAASDPTTVAAFSEAGTYVLRLTVDDEQLTNSDELAITVYPSNFPPVVDAGPDQSISTPSAQLEGRISDDGLPSGSRVTGYWSLVTGPGTATFDDASIPRTRVTFGANGVYVLRLSGNDEQLTNDDELAVTVSGNLPPVVDAGPDQILDLFVLPELPPLSNPPPPVVQPGWTYDVAQPGWTHPSPYYGQAVNKNGMATDGTNLWVAANRLAYVNGVYCEGLARWDGCQWNALVDTNIPANYWSPSGLVTRASYFNVASWSSNLYIAGSFHYQTGSPNGTIGSFYDGTHWHTWTFPNTVHPYVSVNDLEAVSNGIYVVGTGGGIYPTVTNTSPLGNLIMFWDGTNWLSLGAGIVDISGDLGRGNVYVVKADGRGNVYAGGVFTMQCSNGLARNIAHWDGSNWWAMGGGISTPSPWEAAVYAIELATNGDVYVGGSFYYAGSTGAYSLARWDGTNWYPVGAGVQNGAVYGLKFWKGDLYVGANYTVAGIGSRVGRWNGTTWYTLGAGSSNGVDQAVNAVETLPSGVFFGGEFMIAGGRPSYRIAQWGFPPLPTLECAEPVTIPDAPADGADVVLTATVGHPCGAPLTVTWNADGGPAEFTNTVVGAVPSMPTSFTNHYSVGVHPVTITVSDGRTPTLLCNTRVIVLTRASTVLPGIVTDDGLPAGITNIQWTLVSGPTNSAISNPQSAITAASFGEPGTYILRLTADDTEYTNWDEATIHVRPLGVANTPPSVNAGPDRNIALGGAAELDGVIADDGLPVGSEVRSQWSEVSGPGTASFACATCAATTVSFSDPGAYLLRLTASDGELEGHDDVAVNVSSETNSPPVVDAGEDQVAMLPQGGGVVSVPLSGSFTDDGLPWGMVYGLWSGDGPAYVVFKSRDGVYYAVFGVPGIYTLHLQASDGDLFASDDVRVTVLPYVPPPVLEITSPTNTTQVTAPTLVIGTVSSPVLASWRLEYRMAPSLATPEPPGEGGSSYSVVATGSTQVLNSELGTLDPTLSLNGTYELRLVAFDQAGRGATSDTVNVVFDKNMKVGLFTLSFEDLSVPLEGIPIQVIRTYDSRNAMAGRQGDFGIGWTLSLKDVRLQKNRPLGTRWLEEITGFVGGLGIPRYEIAPVKDRVVTVTLPDNSVYRFKAVFNPSVQAGVPIIYGTLEFEPLPGTYGSLAVEGAETVQAVGDVPYYDPFGGPSLFSGIVDLIDPVDGTDYEPQLFRFITQDGTAYVIHETEGLKKVLDLNGNEVQYTASGIFHSSGQSVQFLRDAQDRIIQIVDPSGSTLNYAYNTNNDLVAFTDRTTNTTSYSYSYSPAPSGVEGYSHLLEDLFDSRSIRVIRGEYDSSGRLIRQVDADGNPIEFTHDLENRRETITDRLGNVTIHEYDDDGNVVKTTDALTNITTRVYDDFDNEIATVDALGHVSTSTYDERGNKLTETDSLSNTVTYTYNSFSQPLTITDARGNTTHYTYDGNGNLLLEADALGNLTTHTYDGAGNMLTRTDALSNRWEYGYDALGRQTSEVVRSSSFVVLRSASYTYDANGNRVSSSLTINHGPLTMLVTSNLYDSANRLISVTHPDGSVTRTEYNEIGKETARIDELGRRTEMEYNDRGELIRTTYPDGGIAGAGYDAEGRKVAETNQAGYVTAFEYDALGRLLATIHPDGAVEETEYDSGGRAVRRIDALGNITSYGYQEGCTCSGRRSTVTNALGQVTQYAYDENGNIESVTDARGHTTEYVYDALNRRTQVIFPDSTLQVTTYDALGRRIAETDQAGITTTFGYDPEGRLVAVTNAIGGVTRYEYDELGNQTLQIDANGHVTRFEWDDRGRRTKRILPEGQQETHSYDAAGNMTNKVDFDGQAIFYEYDSMNRLLRKTPDPSFGAPAVQFGYDALGLRTNMADATGETAFRYDSRGRLLEKATPLGRLSYDYDAGGNLLEIQSSNSNGVWLTYAYDSLNRLRTVDDHRAGLTMYHYDEVGNLEDCIYPNGVNHVWRYDALNRLTNLAVNSVTSPIANYAYALNPSGHRTEVRELSGRTVGYGYDDLYRVVQETISGALVAGQVSYTYDAVGNRLNRTSTLTDILSKLYDYDADDRLGGDTYDDNGNTLAALIKDPESSIENPVSCSYDFENRLLSVTSVSSVVQILYDGDGQRVGKVVNGVTIRYLVDDRNPTGYSQVLEELTDGEVTRVYAFGLDLLSQDQVIGTNWVLSLHSYDGLGSVRQLTDEAGEVTDTFDYDAFGGLISRTGTTPNNYLYTGECLDPDIGLYFLRARYLDVDRGRFWTGDSFEGLRHDPATLHRYLYANADPVRFSDPTGHMRLAEVMVVGYVISTLATMATPWYHDEVVIKLQTHRVFRDFLHAYIVIEYGRWKWVVSAHPDPPMERWIGPASEVWPENTLLHAWNPHEWRFSAESEKEVVSEQELLRAGGPGFRYRLLFYGFAQRVNSWQVLYRPNTKNSNAYACTAAREVISANPRMPVGAVGCDYDLTMEAPPGE